MAEVFNPGDDIMLDELMFQWLGKVNALGDPKSLSNLSVVERKPTPVGAEITAAGDVQTKMIIRMEFCEGVIRHAQQEYYDDYGHSIAKSLRLTKPWHDSDRTVAMDSWFMSVNAMRGSVYVYSQLQGCACRAAVVNTGEQ